MTRLGSTRIRRVKTHVASKRPHPKTESQVFEEHDTVYPGTFGFWNGS